MNKKNTAREIFTKMKYNLLREIEIKKKQSI